MHLTNSEKNKNIGGRRIELNRINKKGKINENVWDNESLYSHCMRVLKSKKYEVQKI